MDKQDIRNEYRPIPKKASVGAIMMVKNEKKCIGISLETIKGLDAFIVYDTGSTDETVDIITKFCEEHKINLYMKFGTFVNFSVSRNVLMEFAETVPVKFLLHMDCNDQLRGQSELRRFVKIVADHPSTGFLMCQQWFHGGIDKYYTIRMTKNRAGWRYFDPVHEYCKDTTPLKEGETEKKVFRVTPEEFNFYLYQDRTQDDDKTSKRFARDRELLIGELEKNPENSRALFYLAQTYSCLGDTKNSYETYKLRFAQDGYNEERYISALRCAEMAMHLGKDEDTITSWLLKGMGVVERVEVFNVMALYYINLKKWRMAHYFSQMAISLPYTSCNLFVDKLGYDYKRWKLHAWCSIYFAQEPTQDPETRLKLMRSGMKSSLIAIKSKNCEEDRGNIETYTRLLYGITD